MAASISLAAPFIVCTDTFKWNPRLRFMRPTRDQILFSRWPVGFLYRIQAIPGSNHSNSKNSVPNPADAEPPEVSDDDEEDDSNLSRFARVEVQAARERRKQQKNYERNKHVFLAALEDEKQHAALLAALEDEKQHTAVKDDDQRDEMDFFEELDDIVAMKADKEVIEMRRKELIGKGLVRITPDSLKALQQQDDDELVQPEVIVDDLDEIRELQGLTFIEKRPRKEEEEDDDAELAEGLRRRPPEVVRRRSAEGIRGPAEGIRRRPEEGIRSRPAEDMRRRGLRRRPPEVVRRRSAEGIRGPAEVIRRRPAEDMRSRPAEGFRERPAEGVRRRPPVGVRRRVRSADGTGRPARPLRRRRRRVRRVRMPSDVPSEADLEDSEPETPLFEPEFSTTLAELLDEAKVIPVSVDGDLEVEITGIQHDSREVNPGDLFVCCTGSSTSGHIYLTEAVKRGAVAMIVSKEIPVEEAVGVKAMVMVEDVNANLPALSASFYGNPSQKLTVIGITGTNGKTTTSYLIKSMYEAMGLKTGLLGTINYYIHSNHKLEAPLTTPDALYMTKLMAKMVHNNTEACVMEASSHGLAQGRCDNVDFDIAVFMNLTRDHLDFHKTEEKYKEAKGKLFTKMTDPERHRKVVNIDDPNAPYFIAQGNPDVPLITFSMANKDADVYALEVKLSLFETQVLVSTPEGKLEISSGLLGRHNVYNMLAAVAVGIAVGAPLDEIVKGIEEVDKVPGRMELIDEEQTFAVIVDYAHTPDALARLLDSVRECGAKRIITVFGCGGDRDLGKRPMMTKIATDKSDVCILTSDNPRSEDPLDILDDMLAGVGWTMQEYLRYGKDDYYPPLPNGHRLFVHDIRFIAVRAGVAMAEAHDAVVIAGKGHEAYQIIGEEKKYFDDREECREALHHVNRLHRSGVDTREFPWRVPASY